MYNCVEYSISNTGYIKVLLVRETDSDVFTPESEIAAVLYKNNIPVLEHKNTYTRYERKGKFLFGLLSGRLIQNPGEWAGVGEWRFVDAPDIRGNVRGCV